MFFRKDKEIKRLQYRIGELETQNGCGITHETELELSNGGLYLSLNGDLRQSMGREYCGTCGKVFRQFDNKLERTEAEAKNAREVSNNLDNELNELKQETENEKVKV